MGHDVDILLAQARVSSEVTIPDGWGQGRATFGGLVAGILVARALGELDVDETALRSVTTNFVAPASSGSAHLQVEILRQGKSATQVEARLIQSEQDADPTLRALALMTFGAARESSVEIEGENKLPDVSIDDVEPIPSIKGVTPDFIAQIDMRPVAGQFPFSGADSGDLTGYMRFRQRTDHFGLAHLVTLIDAWPPAPGQMLKSPAPMSTMTWTLELVAPVPADPSIDWWYEVETNTAHEGYAHTEAKIHGSDGKLVAISRQTVALFG